ncbi:diguanylate cyclase domain-containing protein [Arboricoccus pini]|nr:diguanylate cyclase [Arboricoccus pini]
MPLAGVIGLVLVAMLCILFWTAHEQNTLAVAQEQRLAIGAIRVRGDYIAETTLDYARSEEAVDTLVNGYDRTLVDRNIGRPAYENFGFAMTFIIGAGDRTIYAMIDGKPVPPDRFPHLGGGFEALLSAYRQGPVHGRTAGVILADGMPAIAAIVGIRPLIDVEHAREQRTLLVFVDLLNQQRLSTMASAYLLPDLQLGPLAAVLPNDRTALVLRSVDGTPLGLLNWISARPGSELLRRLLPFLAIISASVGLLTWFVLRHAAHTAERVRESEAKAMLDPLTGLPNRLLLYQRLDRRMLDRHRRSQKLAVLYLDLDGFKAVNDQYGHEAGDALLKEIATRLQASKRLNDTLARLGGDEFALICHDVPDTEAADIIARKLIDTLRDPFHLRCGEAHIDISVTLSIGIALTPPFVKDGAELLRRADIALYRAKAAGKQTWVIYDDGDTARGKPRLLTGPRPIKKSAAIEPPHQIDIGIPPQAPDGTPTWRPSR